LLDLIYFPVLVFAVVIHECAHGLVAKWCGDNTAYYEGRITLNPIKHIDLWGTIVIPVILVVTGAGILFGWAKPVPVNPNNYRNYRRDDILVSFAGPASNFLLAIFSAVIIIIVSLFFEKMLVDAFGVSMANSVYEFLSKSIILNLVLAVFNLIPVPPLDGSHLIASLLPYELAEQYRSLGFIGMFVLILLMSVGIIGRVMNPILNNLLGVIQSMINFFTT